MCLNKSTSYRISESAGLSFLNKVNFHLEMLRIKTKVDVFVLK